MSEYLERVRRALRRDATLGTLLEHLTRVHADRRLVEEHGGGLTLTYAQAGDRVARLAGGLVSILAGQPSRPRCPTCTCRRSPPPAGPGAWPSP